MTKDGELLPQIRYGLLGKNVYNVFDSTFDDHDPIYGY